MTEKIDSIIGFIEKQLCDTSRSYEWDNNGLQIKTGRELTDRVGLALDPTMDVIDSAIDKGCGLLITHHPLFFNKLKRISSKELVSQKIIKAIKNDLSIYSYHTNFDLADYSLNDYLAEQLGLKVISYLEKFSSEKYYKYVVYVPKGYENLIYKKCEDIGVGILGNYSSVSFTSDGVGRFRPMEGANPFIGEKGELEEVNEYRIEVLVEESKLKRLIEGIIAVHPYEEVAYDVYPLKYERDFGLGRIASLVDPMGMNEFKKYICEKLKIDSFRINGEFDFTVDKVAILTGSGATYWKNCKSLGVNLLITGDMKHHDAIDAYENGIAILDLGHYQTERVFMNYLHRVLSDRFNVEVFVIDEKKPILNYNKEDF
ncbi:MAG: Nif3-like dinuclear metal center hexameric protein [Calditerrivibrio sp.]|nr:Nif3-like dinuclear metal center hexameric protein [Calditerrivibrio sp.]